MPRAGSQGGRLGHTGPGPVARERPSHLDGDERRVTPQTIERVEAARVLEEHVHDHVAVVQQSQPLSALPSVWRGRTPCARSAMRTASATVSAWVVDRALQIRKKSAIPDRPCRSSTVTSRAFLSSAARAARRTTASAGRVAITPLGAVQPMLADVGGDGLGHPVGQTPTLARAAAQVGSRDRQRGRVDQERRPGARRRRDRSARRPSASAVRTDEGRQPELVEHLLGSRRLRVEARCCFAGRPRAGPGARPAAAPASSRDRGRSRIRSGDGGRRVPARPRACATV